MDWLIFVRFYFHGCVLIFSLVKAANAVSRGSVRFYRNGHVNVAQLWTSGIVQIYSEDENNWGNICDGYFFGSEEANVLCHQFSFTGASSYTNTRIYYSYGTDSSDTYLDDVYCLSRFYRSITQCILTTSTSLSYCSNGDVIVFCYATRIWSILPTAGDIRLTGGVYSSQGLLQIYCNGQWGTVCGNYFTGIDAIVACRQLGYNDVKNYNHLPLQGTLLQPIWLKYFLYCSSCHTCLTQCSGGCPLLQVTSCSHYQDVTLECEYDSFRPYVLTTTYSTCSTLLSGSAHCINSSNTDSTDSTDTPANSDTDSTNSNTDPTDSNVNPIDSDNSDGPDTDSNTDPTDSDDSDSPTSNAQGNKLHQNGISATTIVIIVVCVCGFVLLVGLTVGVSAYVFTRRCKIANNSQPTATTHDSTHNGSHAAAPDQFQMKPRNTCTVSQHLDVNGSSALQSAFTLPPSAPEYNMLYKDQYTS